MSHDDASSRQSFISLRTSKGIDGTGEAYILPAEHSTSKDLPGVAILKGIDACLTLADGVLLMKLTLLLLTGVDAKLSEGIVKLTDLGFDVVRRGVLVELPRPRPGVPERPLPGVPPRPPPFLLLMSPSALRRPVPGDFPRGVRMGVLALRRR
jgi:hypothetical protein